MTEPILEPLIEKAQAIQRRLISFSTLEPGARMVQRIRRASEIHAGMDAGRPICIALIGGTGAGKSRLFNSLVGIAEASPTAVERGCTKVPFIASTTNDFALLQPLRELGAMHVPFNEAGVALVDTPDLDSAELGHREITRAVVEASDVIVYVTFGDKVSNFDIDKEVRTWASRKRWFFVLNKADQNDGTLGEIRQHFDERLEAIGFKADKQTRFCVSATQPDRFDFDELRRAAFSARAAESVKMLRAEAFLNVLEFSIGDEDYGRIERLAAKLKQDEDELNNRVIEVYRSALEKREVADAMRLLVRERTWQHLAGRIGWFMGLVVWVKWRITFVATSWRAGRMLTRQPSGLALAQAVIGTALSVFRGSLPLRLIGLAIDEEARRKLSQIDSDARRALEDMGMLQSVSASINADITCGDPVTAAWISAIETVPIVGKNTARAIYVSAQHGGASWDVIAPLQTAIETEAAESARRAAGWELQILTNLPPAAVLAHVTWRVCEGWFAKEWLPTQFYEMAAAIFLLSFIPGAALLAARVRQCVRLPNPDTITSRIEHPMATESFRAVRIPLEELLRDIRDLRESIRFCRAMLTEDLAVRTFGVTAHMAERNQGEH